MKTPWGMLKDLDLQDHELAASILLGDKHQLIEGLVVECLFDQVVRNMPGMSTRQIIPVDIETVVAIPDHDRHRHMAFVWARNLCAGLGRCLAALDRCMQTFLLLRREGTFKAAPTSGGKRSGEWRDLECLVAELSGRPSLPFKVSPSVRDTNRQRQAFWGFLSDYYGNTMGERVVLPRLLINHGIQPHFRAVWNLDRFLVRDNEVWLFEIKHKFPMERGRSLSFGINNGELALLSRLSLAGIRCLHVIMVKPVWNKESGSMHLLNDLNLRNRTAIIATVIDSQSARRFRESPTRRSGIHTSLTGESTLSYKSLGTEHFVRIGVLGDPPSLLAENLKTLMDGGTLLPVTPEWLIGLRASSKDRATGAPPGSR